MARPTDYRPEFCAIAEQVLANGESLAAVCAEIEITRPTLNAWREAHPEFNESVCIGLSKAQRDWERLGRNGIEGNLEKFSGAPWIFTMKNRFRDDYKDDKKEESNDAVSVLEKIMTGELKVKQ